MRDILLKLHSRQIHWQCQLSFRCWSVAFERLEPIPTTSELRQQQIILILLLILIRYLKQQSLRCLHQQPLIIIHILRWLLAEGGGWDMNQLWLKLHCSNQHSRNLHHQMLIPLSLDTHDYSLMSIIKSSLHYDSVTSLK